MAKQSLSWPSDEEAWAAFKPHLPKNQPGKPWGDDHRVIDLGPSSRGEGGLSMAGRSIRIPTGKDGLQLRSLLIAKAHMASHL